MNSNNQERHAAILNAVIAAAERHDKTMAGTKLELARHTGFSGQEISESIDYLHRNGFIRLFKTGPGRFDQTIYLARDARDWYMYPTEGELPHYALRKPSLSKRRKPFVMANGDVYRPGTGVCTPEQARARSAPVRETVSAHPTQVRPNEIPFPTAVNLPPTPSLDKLVAAREHLRTLMQDMRPVLKDAGINVTVEQPAAVAEAAEYKVAADAVITGLKNENAELRRVLEQTRIALKTTTRVKDELQARVVDLTQNRGTAG